MAIAVGVAFKRVAKSYWFDPGMLDLKDMDRVIVDTARGLELGTGRVTAREIPLDELQAPLKAVIRLAEERDQQQEARNRDKAKRDISICSESVKQHCMDMKLFQSA